jgi:hypothetical protein
VFDCLARSFLPPSPSALTSPRADRVGAGFFDHPGLAAAPTHDLLFIDHGAVRPFNSEDVVALPGPVPREGRNGNILAWQVARLRLSAFATRVYRHDYPLFLNHLLLILSPAAG